RCPRARGGPSAVPRALGRPPQFHDPAAGRGPGPPDPAGGVPRAAGATAGRVPGPTHPARVRTDEPGAQASRGATRALSPHPAPPAGQTPPARSGWGSAMVEPLTPRARQIVQVARELLEREG